MAICVLPGVQERAVSASSVMLAEEVSKEENRSCRIGRIEHTSEYSSRVARELLALGSAWQPGFWMAKVPVGEDEALGENNQVSQ